MIRDKTKNSRLVRVGNGKNVERSPMRKCIGKKTKDEVQKSGQKLTAVFYPLHSKCNTQSRNVQD